MSSAREQLIEIIWTDEKKRWLFVFWTPFFLFIFRVECLKKPNSCYVFIRTLKV